MLSCRVTSVLWQTAVPAELIEAVMDSGSSDGRRACHWKNITHTERDSPCHSLGPNAFLLFLSHYKATHGDAELDSFVAELTLKVSVHCCSAPQLQD